MSDSRNNLDDALALAKRGWPVFPCHTEIDGDCSCGKSCASPAKHPMTPHGHKDATCDLDRVRAYWAKTPWANIGIATGIAFWVLDVDGEAGLRDLAEWEAKHGPLPKTLMVRTGGGGLHYYFALPPGIEVRNRTRIGGLSIDVRGLGGYVLGAGSRNMEGVYEWVQ
jgi:hypothetical protein